MIAFGPEDRILVTGAGSGIGLAVAKTLNALGALVLASGRDREKLERAKAEAARPEAFLVEIRDLCEAPETLPQWIADLRARHGKLRGLALCAGKTLTAPLREFKLAAAHELFDLLFHAPMLLAKGFADRRNNSGKGAAMVFIAAAGALTPVPGLSAYAAAKGALITAARCISRELASQGIRVNCISPGLVDSPMSREYAELIGQEAFEAVLATYPLGLGSPDDVAQAAAFLLSDQARWITGQNLPLTGGWC